MANIKDHKLMFIRNRQRKNGSRWHVIESSARRDKRKAKNERERTDSRSLDKGAMHYIMKTALSCMILCVLACGNNGDKIALCYWMPARASSSSTEFARDDVCVLNIVQHNSRLDLDWTHVFIGGKRPQRPDVSRGSAIHLFCPPVFRNSTRSFRPTEMYSFRISQQPKFIWLQVKCRNAWQQMCERNNFTWTINTAEKSGHSLGFCCQVGLILAKRNIHII